MEDGGAVSTRPLRGLDIESSGMMISVWYAWYLSIRRVTPVSRDYTEVGRVHFRVPSGRSKGTSPTDGGIGEESAGGAGPTRYAWYSSPSRVVL